MNISGSTRPIAILGSPLGHSLSPLMHNYLFRIAGLNNVYIPLEVNEKDLESAVIGLWSLGFLGANVTIPYKELIMDYLIDISEEARLIGAVNTLICSEQGFRGDNTDGKGFINSLLMEKDWRPYAKRAVIFGAGGSARAVCTALALNGTEEIAIVNRSLPRANDIRNNITAKVGAKVGVMLWEDRGLQDAISKADIIINTTPLGMEPKINAAPPINMEWLDQGQLVVDLIYNPLKTKLLEEASLRGCEVLNGLGMLIHQGVLSFKLWTGIEPPFEGLRDLLEKSLALDE
ncbi:MAG: hypothetical protein VR72_17430 [Clostridiaceae bacterium BRH_c20a]|nr:MAG: hypothetical protein VR72_17430 [Clostridiaceae bacterium BRH_c20a]